MQELAETSIPSISLGLKPINLVDNLILLVNGGRLVYYGQAYPDAPEYFSGFTPSHTSIQPIQQTT